MDAEIAALFPNSVEESKRVNLTDGEVLKSQKSHHVTTEIDRTETKVVVITVWYNYNIGLAVSLKQVISDT